MWSRSNQRAWKQYSCTKKAKRVFKIEQIIIKILPKSLNSNDLRDGIMFVFCQAL